MNAPGHGVQDTGRLKTTARHAMSDFWLAAFSLTLAIGWLLPNHYPPWRSFHFDAWSAATFAVVAFVVTVRVAGPVRWSALTLLVLVLLPLPWLQLMAGIGMLAGNSWISTAYLLAFLLTVLVGARWAATGAQATDGLFLAIGIGAIASVGLQLHQWLALDRLDIWSMGEGFGRPFANFGQPNQLGTFLIWGLLAGAWGHARGKLGASTAIGYAMFLLFGVSLTASRTAWIAVGILVMAAWVWRGLWPNRQFAWVVTILGLYFALCVATGNWMSRMLTGEALLDAGPLARMTGESRPAIWSMFIEASAQRPWLGYGWNQVSLAQVAVADQFPARHVHFSQSHNLFLDLVLWCGVPIGLAVSAFLVVWVVRRVVGVRTPEQALLVVMLLVVANHAMLELPLHYAYFLLPTGLVMGILESRQNAQTRFVTRRRVLIALWAIGVALLVLMVRDYWRVERSYEALRFEWSNIKSPRAVEPDVLLLTQWRDFFHLVRFEPKSDMNDAELRAIENTVAMFPSAGFVQRLAVALALNNRPLDAARWLRRICKIAPQSHCDALKTSWANQAGGDSRIAAVPWPGL